MGSSRSSEPPPLVSEQEPPTFERTFPAFTHFVEIAPGFWHCRAPFVLKKGPLSDDIKTHMSVCRLSSGKFVCIDAVKLAQEAKAELDQLTDNGNELEAVFHTHPFHSVAIASFHVCYPSSSTRKWFGCPRHLAMFTVDEGKNPITWSGDLRCCEVRKMYEPDVAMQIPAGSEFVDPKPPTSNHFSTVFVLHRSSKTLHVDDCIMYFDKPSALMRLFGKKCHSMEFHNSICGPGLYPTEQAPMDFKNWLSKLLDEWEIDHIVAAHMGNCYNNGNDKLRKCLDDAEATFIKIAKRNAGKEPAEATEGYTDDPNAVECG